MTTVSYNRNKMKNTTFKLLACVHCKISDKTKNPCDCPNIHWHIVLLPKATPQPTTSMASSNKNNKNEDLKKKNINGEEESNKN